MKTRTLIQVGSALALAGLTALVARAQNAPAASGGSMSKSLGLVAFPAKGQSAEQQHKDDYDCYVWSKGQTNYDPLAPPPTPTAAPVQAQQGGAVKGAAKGAAAGAAVGAVAGDAGTGAAAGATAGAIKGRQQRKKSQQEAQKQAQAQQAAAAQGPRDLFKKAFSACLEGKGYSVK